MGNLGKIVSVTICWLFLTSSLLLANEPVITLSTTTSTQASGLLDILIPVFSEKTGIKVKVLAKGTGAAILDGIDGNVDIIFVHARSREDKFVAEGYGTKRYAVMHNDFVILGPPDDPAKIGGLKDAVKALAQISSSRSLFISRGDDSGTHTQEQALWKSASLPLKKAISTYIKNGKKKEISYLAPEGNWYHSLGQGMGKVLRYADEKRAYTLTDRGTYLKYRFGSSEPIDLNVLCEGDNVLFNPYGVIPVDPKRHPHVKYKKALQFAEWLVSSQAQHLIGEYKVLGKQLFHPNTGQ